MNKGQKERSVIPGERLGSAGKLRGGENTYTSGGIIFSSVTGEAWRNRRGDTVNVVSDRSTPHISPGDDVICQVEDIDGNIARCRVLTPERMDMGTHPYDLAYLHLSRISPSYIEKIRDMIRTGDVLRAKVISADPVIEINTLFREYGVILSRCPECRQLLEMHKENILKCQNCGREIKKRAAMDYGRGEEETPDVDRSHRFPLDRDNG